MDSESGFGCDRGVEFLGGYDVGEATILCLTRRREKEARETEKRVNV
jgi:hypothetical protein